jgi:SAM-dependent methyltransferase
MNPLLREESERLARSWMQQDAGELRDYLVSEVEDPRLNLQSILTRHVLAGGLLETPPVDLMMQEYRFSTAMNWLFALTRETFPPDWSELLHGLTVGADNVEGTEIPSDVLQTFQILPQSGVPNYIEGFLKEALSQPEISWSERKTLDTFGSLWRGVFAAQPENLRTDRLSVLEPACGSANDYRFMAAYGLAARLDYTGLDICQKNISNARALFPEVEFKVGNAFELGYGTKAFDWCVIHDLFEHLSPEGIETAVGEICNATRVGIAVGFFNMEEIPEHVVRPVADYHWNRLSMAQMRELFEKHGFHGQVLNVSSFLQRQTGCGRFHNLHAYTFLLQAVS